MATNEQLVKHGRQLLFADHATDFEAAPNTAANSLIIGSPTDYQFDLTGVTASGGARQAVKADLLTPWGNFWLVMACLEFEAAPADGGNVEFWWASSPSATAGIGNSANTTGADASYTSTFGALAQTRFIGNLTVRNNVINIGMVGVFKPLNPYGNLVVVNRASTALRSTATAMDETHITLTEIIDETQAAS